MGKEKILLAELRKKQGLSQKALAKQINVCAGTIGMYEIGKRTPSLDRALRISEFFGIPLENISFSSLDRVNEGGKKK